jgi:quercetin dioxygenase-like cupin family protein
MKWGWLLLGALVLLAGCAGSSAAPKRQASVQGPLTKYRNTEAGLNASGSLDLIQNVLDFAPGAASVVHTHSTPNLATVLQGQITVKTPTGDKTGSAGGGLMEPIGQPVQAVNTGSTEAMVAVGFAVPHGGKPTSPVAGQPAPPTPNTTLYSFTLASANVSGGYSIFQQVLDFAPGSRTPAQRFGGPGVVTVLQGRLTLSADGVEKTYGMGEGYTEVPDQTLQAFNRDTAELVVVATYLLPDGAQLTTSSK